MKVKIYSTETCPHCKAAKEYFKSNNIEFENFDVSKNEEDAKKMVELSGQNGVPVIDIHGKVIVGFNQEKIEEALKN